jgi:quercetin dioxygenase-like cupin family protein
MPGPCRKENLWMLGALFRVHVRDGDNANGVYVLEQVLPPGFSPPLHIHYSEDEVFYMLAGEIRFQVGEATVTVRSGDTLMAAKGVGHSFIVTSAEPAHMLTMTREGDFERMVRTVGRPAERDELPPQDGAPTPEEMAAFEAACRVSKIEVVGPPLAQAA